MPTREAAAFTQRLGRLQLQRQHLQHKGVTASLSQATRPPVLEALEDLLACRLHATLLPLMRFVLPQQARHKACPQGTRATLGRDSKQIGHAAMAAARSESLSSASSAGAWVWSCHIQMLSAHLKTYQY